MTRNALSPSARILATACAAACLSLFLSLCLASAARAFDGNAFQAAQTHLQAANAGDDSAVGKAVQGFEPLVRSEPANPLLLVNLGAATAMQARSAWLPWKKMSYAEDGMAMLDKALALLTPKSDTTLHRDVPVSLQVRFTAASTFLGVPGFFNRGAQGEKLLREVLASPLFEASPLPFKSAVWMRAARWASDGKRPDEARRYLNAVIASNAPNAAAAKAQLETLQ